MWHSVPTTSHYKRALAIACILTLVWSQGARRVEAQVLEPSIELRLVTQPISHAPDDRLGIKLAIRNRTSETLDGFRLSVAVFSRVLNRTALHASFDAVAGLSGAIPRDFTDVRVLPGESVTVSLDNPVASVPLLSQATEGGVYPLQVSLFDAEAPDVPIDSLITPLIYYPSEPETRLNLVLVLPLNDTPSRTPDGDFDAGEEERSSLELALSEDGWLTGILDALENRAGANLHLAIAPAPRLLEELADISSGYGRVVGDETEEVPVEAPIPRAAADAIARLKLFLARRGVQPLLVPYAFPDLPSLVESTDSLALAKQITVAQAVLAETFGEAEPATDPRWLFPPAGRLDAATLEQLALTPGADAAQRTFFSETSLTALPEPGGCPGTSPSFTCPVEVTTGTGSTVGFPYDAGLRERLADLVRGTEVRLAVQKLFAETAMIREEQPGVEGRVVHATIPSLFHPSPRVSNLIMKGFAQAKWLTTMTPAEGLANSVEPLERQIVATSEPIADQPDEAFFSMVNGASLTVARYGEIEPPPGRLQRLERNVLIALSRSWWGGQEAPSVGASYAFDSQDEAEGEMSKITIGGVDEITLTSRQGEIQFPLFNGAEYPVTLKVVLDGRGKLDVSPSEIEQRFEDSTQQITFEATAQASGAFPVEVSVRTPRSNSPITSKVITIRSTKFNQIALGITIGALAFLILFYALRALRRRRSSSGATSA